MAVGNSISAQVDIFKPGLFVTSLDALAETDADSTIAISYITHFRLRSSHCRLLSSFRQTPISSTTAAKLRSMTGDSIDALEFLMGFFKQNLEVLDEQREVGLRTVCDNHREVSPQPSQL